MVKRLRENNRKKAKAWYENEANKEKRKKYYEENIDHIKQLAKGRYEMQKGEIKARRQAKKAIQNELEKKTIDLKEWVDSIKEATAE